MHREREKCLHNIARGCPSKFCVFVIVLVIVLVLDRGPDYDYEYEYE